MSKNQSCLCSASVGWWEKRKYKEMKLKSQNVTKKNKNQTDFLNFPARHARFTSGMRFVFILRKSSYHVCLRAEHCSACSLALSPSLSLKFTKRDLISQWIASEEPRQKRWNYCLRLHLNTKSYSELKTQRERSG